MKKELISIIIPVYNRANIISKTINNILEQTYKNIEIIIVDDGSNDNIDSVMEKYKNNKKIKYIKSPENKGACNARNLGVKNSKGEFIAFQDSDDYWNKEKIEKQFNYLKSTDADICICGMKQIYSNKESVFHSKNFNNNRITLENQLGKSFFSTQLIFGKRKCFEEEKFDIKFPRFQDWDLGIRLVKNYNIVYLNEMLVIRNLQDNSISTNQKKGIIAADLLLNKYKELYNKYPKAKAKVLDLYSNLCTYDKKQTKIILKESLYNDFKIKVLIKYFLNNIGILDFITSVKRKNR